MSMYQTVLMKVSLTGSAGSATGTATEGVPNGELVGLSIDVDASQPATLDLTLTASNGGISSTLFNRSNSAADLGWALVRAQCVDNTGAAITGVYDRYPVYGMLTLTAAQGNAGVNHVILRAVIRVT